MFRWINLEQDGHHGHASLVHDGLCLVLVMDVVVEQLQLPPQLKQHLTFSLDEQLVEPVDISTAHSHDDMEVGEDNAEDPFELSSRFFSSDNIYRMHSDEDEDVDEFYGYYPVIF